MATEQITDRTKQLGNQLLEAMKRPDDPALLHAHEREEAAISAALDTFYTQTGQPSAPITRSQVPTAPPAYAAAVPEAYDEPDGASHVRHAGKDPELYQILLSQRAQLQRHRVSEDQRSRRQLAWLASGLLLGSAAILAFAPQSTNVYLGAAFLLVGAGAFGVKSFRIKMEDFEFDAGERSARPSERER